MREVGLDAVRLSTVQGDLFELPAPRLTLQVVAHEGGIRLSLSMDGEPLQTFEIGGDAFYSAKRIVESLSQELERGKGLSINLPELSRRLFPSELAATLMAAPVVLLTLDDKTSWWPWELMVNSSYSSGRHTAAVGRSAAPNSGPSAPSSVTVLDASLCFPPGQS